MRLRFFASIAAGAVITLAPPRDAAACGGCIVQQTESTVVTGHRMAFAMSPTQSVLWDQIQYSGNPKEFAWVLPVKPGAIIEVSTDAWFETLDAATATTVAAPFSSCGNTGFGFGCGAAGTSALAGGDVRGVSDVKVLHEGTVGPYETVTLASSKPGALNAWLTSHAFNVSATTQPVLDAYVKEGFDFIAIRLRPDQGVRQMKPVRITTPGASPDLPLRMVAVGTGPTVSMILFTISEARLAAKNFTNVLVPSGLLVWDFDTKSSNYATLRRNALAAGDSAAWLTSYARARPLLSPGVNVGGGFGTIAAAYFAQGMLNAETTSAGCNPHAFTDVAESSAEVVDPCPPGAKPDDPACKSVSFNQLDARTFTCGALDDLAVALRGLHPRDVWVTRLEANLSRAALAQDLVITPADEQLPVANVLSAVASIGDPCAPAKPVAGITHAGSRGSRNGPLVAVALAVMGFAAAFGRRVRRPRVLQPIR